MDGMLTIIFRTLFLYLFILVIFRVMGKREIGQLSVLDFVVSIMIAELAVISIEDPKTPMIRTLVSISILFGVQIVLAFVSMKNEKIRHYVDGWPTMIINKGKINEKEMRRQRYNFDDLIMQLRDNQVKNLSDVEFAILESTGKLSVYKKQNQSSNSISSGNASSSNTMQELQKGSYSDLDMPLPLILDGKIKDNHLERIHQTPLWLRQQLRELGYKDIKKISYCEMQKDGTFFIDEKDEK